MTEERVAAAWARLAELGFTRIQPADSWDMSEPLTGSEARDVVDGLIGKTGTFRTLQAVSDYSLVEVLDRDGFLTDDDDPDDLSDSLDPHAQFVVLPSASYTGETYSCLCFEYKEPDGS